MDRPVSPRVASVAGIMQLLHCARNCRGKRRLPEWPEYLKGNGARKGISSSFYYRHFPDFLPINFPGEYVNFEEDRYEISAHENNVHYGNQYYASRRYVWRNNQRMNVEGSVQ